MVAPRVIKVEPAYRIGLWNNVVITIIQSTINAAGVREIAAAYDSIAGKYSKGVAGITVLRANLKVGTKETNAEAQRAMTRLRESLLHLAIVIENQSLIAHLLRSVVRTVSVVGRSTRLTIATNIDEATHVIAPHVVVADNQATPELQHALRQAVSEVLEARSPIGA